MKRSSLTSLSLYGAALASITALAFAGCSSDGSGDATVAGSGTAGATSAGSGGTTGSGGKAGSGGAAGTTTTVGSGGTGGSTTSGTAGTTGSSGATGSGGRTGSGGAAGSTGGSGTGGTGGGTGGSGTGGSGTDGGAGRDGGGTGGGSTGDGGAAAKFSFFATSLKAMRLLAKSQDGFGGDFRFGKADGLSGADEICRTIAETSMPGNGKTWRAFLSVAKGPDGTAVNAIDRVGAGPWYDRRARLVAMTKADLQQARPRGMDTAIINDFPNEDGVPNQNPDGTGNVDNHAFLTGSNAMGMLHNTGATATCQDWTSKEAGGGKPSCGYAFPRDRTNNWMFTLVQPGCKAGVKLEQTGGPDDSNPIVGSSGGYGGIYCFALTP